MNINQLKYFQTVSKHKNITKAAEELHISQPSVSNAIKELEMEFGVSLLERRNKKISLTGEGLYFLNKANQLLNCLENFYDEILDLSQKKKHKIKVGIPSIMGTFLLPRIFSSFQKLHPDIQLEFFEYASIDAAKMLTDDVLDLAFILLDNDTINYFNTKMILETEVSFCVNRKNPLSKEKIITFYQLKETPIVLLLEGSYHYKIISKKYKESNATPMIILHSNQLSSLKYFVENNMAATFLYNEVFKENPNIASIPLKDPIKTKIGLIWKKNKYLCDSVKVFINEIHELL
jgi:DNA-binding transcriptional LysR family regulator